MRWEVLLDMKARIEADEALTAYFQSHYGKPAAHVIGFPRPKSAHDYPFVSYVLPRDRRDDDANGRDLRVSVTCGVNQPGIEGGLYLGIQEASEVDELIAGCLVRRPNLADGVWLQGDFESFSDFGEGHPFYWVETVFNFQVRN